MKTLELRDRWLDQYGVGCGPERIDLRPGMWPETLAMAYASKHRISRHRVLIIDVTEEASHAAAPGR